MNKSTLFDILAIRAKERPEDEAFGFLGGDRQRSTLSYAALWRRSKAVGELLQRHSTAGDRVLLVYPPGLEFVVALFGCWAAGRIAVPVYPPRATGSSAMRRFVGILDDAQPAMVLTVPVLMERLTPVVRNAGIACHPTNELQQPTDPHEGDQAGNRSPIALLQYTSGTTAFPKGVIVTHGNLLDNAAVIHRAFGHTPQSHGVIWLPPYHDMGLIGGVLQPVYAGFPVTLMSPVSFLQRPLRWLEAISGRRAVTSGAPNFAYELCLRSISEEDRIRLDLSGWDVAFTGGEPVHAETMARFSAAFSASGFRPEAFYPCYGLAESTLMVTGGEKGKQPRQCTSRGMASGIAPTATSRAGSPVVSCGRAREGARVVIADPTSRSLCEDGIVGEIWVSGPSVAAGYWNRSLDTAEGFGARLNGASSPEASTGPFLRTGDLGFMQGGELHVTGRLKDLIIIRGINHYSTDIESTVATAHGANRPGSGAAFACADAGEERLVIVQEIERSWRREDCPVVADAIRQAVSAGHEIEIHALLLLPQGRIPKTSSGKVQRQAIKSAFIAGTLDAMYEWRQATPRKDSVIKVPECPEPVADLQAWIVSRVAAAVGLEAAHIDANEPLARYGLDSLKAVEIAEGLSRLLGREVSAALFWDHPTIAGLAQELANAAAESGERVDA